MFYISQVRFFLSTRRFMWLLVNNLPIFCFRGVFTAQKMKFSIKDFFSKCDQIRRKLLICSHLLKNSLMGNFLCSVLTYCNGMTDYVQCIHFVAILFWCQKQWLCIYLNTLPMQCIDWSLYCFCNSLLIFSADFF